LYIPYDSTILDLAKPLLACFYKKRKSLLTKVNKNSKKIKTILAHRGDNVAGENRLKNRLFRTAYKWSLIEKSKPNTSQRNSNNPSSMQDPRKMEFHSASHLERTGISQAA
jgi:hypothetical protein